MTNEELLGRLEERLKAQDKVLDSILKEAGKTNGRIGKLEDWRSESKGQWKVLMVLGVVIGFIIESVIELFKK